MVATMSQPMAALEHANEIRLGRADVRRKLASRELSVCELLADPPDAILTWQVGEMLCAQRRWGLIRTQQFLVDVKISWHREIRMLTDRQRRELVCRLDGRHS